MLNDLELVFKTVFPNLKTFQMDLKKEDILEWDSVGHLSLIVELSDKFDISFSKEEIQNIESVKDVVEIIKRKRKRNE